MKVGDRVVSKYKGSNITKGKVYKVTHVSDGRGSRRGGRIIISIETDNGRKGVYFSGVFYTEKELRKLKLEKINDSR